jgi:hypothetical protein
MVASSRRAETIITGGASCGVEDLKAASRHEVSRSLPFEQGKGSSRKIDGSPVQKRVSNNRW